MAGQPASAMSKFFLVPPPMAPSKRSTASPRWATENSVSLALPGRAAEAPETKPELTSQQPYSQPPLHLRSPAFNSPSSLQVTVDEAINPPAGAASVEVASKAALAVPAPPSIFANQLDAPPFAALLSPDIDQLQTSPPDPSLKPTMSATDVPAALVVESSPGHVNIKIEDVPIEDDSGAPNARMVLSPSASPSPTADRHLQSPHSSHGWQHDHSDAGREMISPLMAKYQVPLSASAAHPPISPPRPRFFDYADHQYLDLPRDADRRGSGAYYTLPRPHRRDSDAEIVSESANGGQSKCKSESADTEGARGEGVRRVMNLVTVSRMSSFEPASDVVPEEDVHHGMPTMDSSSTPSGQVAEIQGANTNRIRTGSESNVKDGMFCRHSTKKPASSIPDVTATHASSVPPSPRTVQGSAAPRAPPPADPLSAEDLERIAARQRELRGPMRSIDALHRISAEEQLVAATMSRAMPGHIRRRGELRTAPYPRRSASNEIPPQQLRRSPTMGSVADARALAMSQQSNRLSPPQNHRLAPPPSRDNAFPRSPLQNIREVHPAPRHLSASPPSHFRHIREEIAAYRRRMISPTEYDEYYLDERYRASARPHPYALPQGRPRAYRPPHAMRSPSGVPGAQRYRAASPILEQEERRYWAADRAPAKTLISPSINALGLQDDEYALDDVAGGTDYGGMQDALMGLGEAGSMIKGPRKRVDDRQLAILNAMFAKTAYPSTAVRDQLGIELGMTSRSVQIWFQNRRRAIKVEQQSAIQKIQAEIASQQRQASSGPLRSRMTMGMPNTSGAPRPLDHVPRRIPLAEELDMVRRGASLDAGQGLGGVAHRGSPSGQPGSVTRLSPGPQHLSTEFRSASKQIK